MRAAPRSGSRRCSGCTGSASRRARSRGRTASRPRAGTASRRSSVTCGSPSAWQVSRAAITALGEQHARSESGPFGSSQSRSVTPTACGPALQQRDRAVDAAAHRDRHAPARRAALARPARARSRARRRAASRRRPRPPRAASARAGRPSRPGGVRVDDRLAVDAQPNGRPVRAASRVSEELDHAARVLAQSVRGAEAPLTMLRHRRMCHVRVNLDKPGGCRASRRTRGA